MTRSRLTLASLVIVALLIGIFVGRGSNQPAPSSKSNKPIVSSSAESIRMPGLWLGESFRGGMPILSLTMLFSGKLNGLYYAILKPDTPLPAHALAGIDPLVGPQPVGWKTTETPVGDALVSPDDKYAVIDDPQGNKLRIHSYTGSVKDLLKSLQVTPDS